MAIQKFLKVAKQLAALPAGERKAAIDVAKELGGSEPAPKRKYKKRSAKTVAPGVKVVKRKYTKRAKPEEPAAAAAE